MTQTQAAIARATGNRQRCSKGEWQMHLSQVRVWAIVDLALLVVVVGRIL